MSFSVADLKYIILKQFINPHNRHTTTAIVCTSGTETWYCSMPNPSLNKAITTFSLPTVSKILSDIMKASQQGRSILISSRLIFMYLTYSHRYIFCALFSDMVLPFSYVEQLIAMPIVCVILEILGASTIRSGPGAFIK